MALCIALIAAQIDNSSQRIGVDRFLIRAHDAFPSSSQPIVTTATTHPLSKIIALPQNGGGRAVGVNEKINRFFVVVCFQGVESSTSLDCNITKQRAKGPTGRRLPRQVQSRLFPGPGAAATSAEDGEKRSESLPRLEMDQSLQRLNRKHSTVNNMGMSMTTSTAVSTSTNQLINRLIRLEEGAPPPHPDPSQSNLHDNSDDDNFDSTWFLSVNPTPPIAATSTTSELRTVSTGSNTSTKTRRRRSKLIICAANSNDQTNSTNNRSCQFL